MTTPSNFRLTLISAGKEQLTAALALTNLLPMRYFRISAEEDSIELGYSDSSFCDSAIFKDAKVKGLPFEVKGHEGLRNFLYSWYEQAKLIEDEPDHDGSNKPGFYLEVRGNNVLLTKMWAEYWK